MGKNTMMKRSIRLYCETSGSDKWACLLDQLVGNVGVVFTTSAYLGVWDCNKTYMFMVISPLR